VIPGRSDRLDALAGLASLDEPARRQLYEHVCDQGRPVARDEAAEATGITRTLAAYHLDKLVEAGLLVSSYQRPPGRRAGPGAGRPAKLYQQAAVELAVSVPPRAYELLARLLADAVESDSTGKVRATLNEAARELGRQVGSESGSGDLAGALRACGYQPHAGPEGVLELRNCPFHRLAQEHQPLVCGLNLCLIQGIISGTSHPRARAVLSPHPGRCCVAVHLA
jgi:predicted ArsR family transcriptional regulator